MRGLGEFRPRGPAGRKSETGLSAQEQEHVIDTLVSEGWTTEQRGLVSPSGELALATAVFSNPPSRVLEAISRQLDRLESSREAASPIWRQEYEQVCRAFGSVLITRARYWAD